MRYVKRLVLLVCAAVLVAGLVFPAASYAKNYYDIFKGKQMAVRWNTGLADPEFQFTNGGKKFEVGKWCPANDYIYYAHKGSGNVKVTKNKIKFTYKVSDKKFKKRIPLKSGKTYYYRLKENSEYGHAKLVVYKTKKAYVAKKAWKAFTVGAWQ